MGNDAKHSSGSVTAADDKTMQSGLSDGQSDAGRQIFISSALSMSWQLAVVVLIPVIGGFKLDAHLKSSPLWTLIGFVIALAGMTAVIWRAVKEANERLAAPLAGEKHAQ